MKLDINDFKEYFNNTWIYAESLLHHVNVKKGLEIYGQLYQDPSLDEKVPVKIHEFLHHLVNANLHNWKFEEAIEVLEEHNKMEIKDEYYRFLIYDRYGVVYTALGELEFAKSNFNKAIDISEKIGNKICESIAYSDYGYMHLNITYDSKNVKKYFNKARKIHEQVENEAPLFRKVEIPQQRAIVHFLENEIEAAHDQINKALWICKQTNFTFLKLRLLILKSSCLILEKKYVDADNVLNYARSSAEIFFNDRIRWRAFSNLGSLSLIQLNIEKATIYYETALELLRGQINSQKISSRELPLISNLLLLYYMKKEKHKCKKILRDFPNPKLAKYYNRIQREIKPMEFSKIKELKPFYIGGFEGINLFIT
jgi:tetratricopeptide (TPR) repeat protein